MISVYCFNFISYKAYIILQDLAICVVVVGVVCSCIFYFTVHEKDNPLPGNEYHHNKKLTKKEYTSNEVTALKGKTVNIDKISTVEETRNMDISPLETKRNMTKSPDFKKSFRGIFKSPSSDKILSKNHDSIKRKISSMSCPESDVLARLPSISCPENDIEMSTLRSNTNPAISGILKSESRTKTPSTPKKRISFVSSHSIMDVGIQDRPADDAKPKINLHKHWKEWFREPSFYQASTFLNETIL